MYITGLHSYFNTYRYLVMAWGTKKFLKRLIKLNPNAVPNNELADFISHVPDNEELVSNHKDDTCYLLYYSFIK